MSVDISRLRTLLKFDGVDTSSFTDEELTVLVESKLYELEGFIGADIYPRDRKFSSSNFKGEVVELDFYPVQEIHSIYVNDCCIGRHLYNVNNDLGIIYFHLPFNHGHGRWYGGKWTHHRWHHSKPFLNVTVEYTTGVSDRDFEFLILPLVKDMMGYSLSMGTVNATLGGYGLLASNLHEGDVSIGLANGNKGGGGVDYGYSPGVNGKIDELVKRFRVNARVKWL